MIHKQKGADNLTEWSITKESLTDVERRYSQTEKEALALVWACERFHQYIFGLDFILETDHKPLEFIYSTKSKPSLRIERWVLRLQSYRFTVKYKPGSQNIADSLSRLVLKNTITNHDDTSAYVYFIAESAVPTALVPRELEEAASVDSEMIQLRQCIDTGCWDDCPNPVYKTLKNELTRVGKLVLRGSRLVIPETFHKRVIDIAHEGHQGIVKTKERLRTAVWWPGIDKDAEIKVKSCHACQVVGQPSHPELIMWKKFPDGPWEDLAIDLIGPLPNGESIFVTVDYYSRYVEIAVLKATQTKHIVAALENMFTTHGLPITIQSDNGPQFISEEFTEFIKINGIEHMYTTPLWPRANGEVERQNRTLIKAIRIAVAEGKDWRKELNTFLLAYRSTPHSTTGISPAELLFRRKIQTKLPEMSKSVRSEIEELVRD